MTFKPLRIKTLALRLAVVACAAAVAFGARALPASTYAPTSLLSQGRWVKIAVPQSGVYKITRQQLSQWGFADISKVHVYGYGGRRIADRLTVENYTDDLPVVQSETIADGIVFYAVGPEQWVSSNTGVYHAEYNIYTNEGYYFVSDRELPTAITVPEIKRSGTGGAGNANTTFTAMLQHETNVVSPGEAGYLLVGENFKTQNPREFSFSLPGRVEGTDVLMECTMAVKNYTANGMSFTANGTKLDNVTADRIAAIANTAYIHAGYSTTKHNFPITGEQLRLGVSIDDISSVINAWLNYIAINYTRRIELDASGVLDFTVATGSVRLGSGGRGDVRVWDVTNPAGILAMNTTVAGNNVEWTPDYNGRRQYVAWTPSSALPAPRFVGNVPNQDIHAMDVPGMVIFTLPEFKAQAQRLASIHEQAVDPLSVAVLTVDEVYNEFASGMADVSALRKCLKMFYDRGIAGDTTRLGYALLMGRATVDNRHLTSQFQSATSYNTIPYWMTGGPKAQLSDNDGYGTDDFIAMLEDDSGTNPGLDDLCVAVGRMPVTSVSEARQTIDKLAKYINESHHGTWRNSFLFLADDGDNGIHMKQAEAMISELEATPGQQNFISKVYVDAYDIVGGACEGGRKDMFRMLDEGVVWWSFCGHANNHSWTGERMLTYTDINNLYLKNVPVLMAATCDFLRWDSNTISGGEIMFHEANGGTIATISATRPVYISDNGLFTRAIGRSISLRDADGRLPRLGDIYRHAKNNILTDGGEHRSNTNRLRYVLMGDPAMPLATPSNLVRLEAIDGVAVDPEAQVTLKALQQAKLTGSVCTPDGKVIEDFNGVLMVNIYDAEKSETTKGEREENVVIPFEQHGDKLFMGSATVKNGRFELNVAMPGEVADNFRPATINMYAYSTDDHRTASGINSDFYVYGLDETAAPDKQAPVIHTMVLNETDFADGDDVNTSPLLIADISDDVGINISAAGIGHQMTLTLDGRRTFTDVSLYYTPATDGTPSGMIAYPLSNLTTGEHTLSLRVWDTASNSATRTIKFKVVEGLTPNIYKVYTDVNPARTEVKFYITHNRPQAELTASVTVYDLLGRPLWDTTAKIPSDMHTSYPITWDLCDSSGHRVPRGIYLYRATISDNNGETYSTAAQRLAITAQ